MRFIYCMCRPDVETKWKDIKKEVNRQPIQNVTGDKDQNKQRKNNLEAITGHAWATRFNNSKFKRA